MTRRSSLLILILALAGCSFLALCLGVGIAGYYVYSTNANPLAALNAPAATNRIVFVGNDFNIYLADPSSGATTGLTKDGGNDRVYNYPTWSPDNARLAFVGYTFENGAPKEGALYTISPTGENLTPLYKTAQNFPFYLYWSPDSRVVGFLANKDAQNIALNIARRDEPDSKQEIDFGTPFYWAWSPDSSQLFTHVGGTRSNREDARLGVLPFSGSETKRSLESAPGDFQAPQWSNTGTILYSAQDASSQVIALRTALDREPKKLVTYSGRASFALAPDANQVAYILTDTSAALPHLGAMRVVDATGENMRVISQEPTIAFLWSPDSSRLAYLTATVGENQSNFDFESPLPNFDSRVIDSNTLLATTQPETFFTARNPAQGGELRLQLHWHIWERATNTSHLVASFVPTSSFLSVVPYFDQYANSSTFWSPDSQSLVYTTRETASSGAVYIADATGKTSPRKIGEGVLAFWSWK